MNAWVNADVATFMKKKAFMKPLLLNHELFKTCMAVDCAHFYSGIYIYSITKPFILNIMTKETKYICSTFSQQVISTTTNL